MASDIFDDNDVFLRKQHVDIHEKTCGVTVSYVVPISSQQVQKLITFTFQTMNNMYSKKFLCYNFKAYHTAIRRKFQI